MFMGVMHNTPMVPTILATTLRAFFSASFFLVAVAITIASAAPGPDGGAATQIKVGIIGLDAHAVPWTQLINKADAKSPLSELRKRRRITSLQPGRPLQCWQYPGKH